MLRYVQCSYGDVHIGTLKRVAVLYTYHKICTSVGLGSALAHKPTSHPWLNNNFIECGIHKYIFASTHNHRCVSVYLNNLAGCALRCLAMLCYNSVVLWSVALPEVLYIRGDTDRLFEPTALTARQIYSFRVG